MTKSDPNFSSISHSKIFRRQVERYERYNRKILQSVHFNYKLRREKNSNYEKFELIKNSSIRRTTLCT